MRKIHDTLYVLYVECISTTYLTTNFPPRWEILKCDIVIYPTNYVYKKNYIDSLFNFDVKEQTNKYTLSY